MNIKQHLEQLQNMYNIVAVIDLDPWHEIAVTDRKQWFFDIIQPHYKEFYEPNERLIFTLTKNDVYMDSESEAGYILTQLHHRLNEIDISNFFVILLTTDQTQKDSYSAIKKPLGSDSVPISIQVCEPVSTVKHVAKQKPYKYNSNTPVEVDIEDLTEQEKYLLTESKTFCMYPWIHFHAYPTGHAYACCMADMQYPVGNMREHTIKEIWNQTPMKELRRSMLSDQPSDACRRCYEQEESGFFSVRQSANKHHGHHIDRIHNTQSDGTLDQFELTYWDIRFSNLCNLRCRSCGHIFSSQWYQDQAQLSGPEWKKTHKVLNYAGRFEIDAFDQLIEHIDHVEQIYFAGGEPLLMEEHYRILDELLKRKLFNVRLIYNTNFTHTDLKGRSVFEYWKQFKKVAVGASLDASGTRAEYIRKGTDWSIVEHNRQEMMRICPNVDFYISPTLSILNALHLPDFHRDWTERGLIRAQDLNVNILQDPAYYRIDIAPAEYKQQLTQRYQDHLNWLKDQGDSLGRATQGFESAIKYLNATDNSHLIDKFWHKTQELDSIRNESCLDVIPELQALK